MPTRGSGLALAEGGAAYAILTDMGGKLDQDLVRAFLPLAEAAGPTPRIRLG